MFIRVVNYEIKPGMMEEAEKVYHNVTAQALQDQAGFQSGYALINTQTGIALTVGVWNSKEDFEKFSSTGAGKELPAQITPLLANPPSVNEFDRMLEA